MREFRIVVAAHGDLADSLLASARMIGGELPGITAVGLHPGTPPADFRSTLATALGADEPVLVLTDLRGGTPDNVSQVLARQRSQTAVIANVSLAMLLEAALGGTTLTTENISALIELASPVVTAQVATA
jgi:PTS system mannose-specific IIA component